MENLEKEFKLYNTLNPVNEVKANKLVIINLKASQEAQRKHIQRKNSFGFPIPSLSPHSLGMHVMI